MKALLATLLLAASIYVSAQAEGAGPGPKGARRSPEGYLYSTKVEPAAPKVGELAIVELGIEGLSASGASAAELELDPGLKLEAESLRPGPGGAAAPRTELRLELRVLEPGEQRIRSLALLAKGGARVRLGPVVVCPAPGRAETGAGWSWVAPRQVYRYQAFELRLEPGAGSAAVEAAALRAPAFELPSEASVEASGRLAWTVIAFEAGELALPKTTLGPGRSAEAATMRVLPLPTGLSASRAIGSFTASLSQPGSALPLAGAPLRLRLDLSGRGNIPALILPEPSIRLNGEPLPRSSWSSTRSDSAKAEGGSYSGRASLGLEIIPPRAGLLSISFPSLPLLEPLSPASAIRLLPLPSRELRIGAPSPSRAAPARGEPAWGPNLGTAAAAWGKGDKGRALALLYGSLRRAAPFSREAGDARRAAISCSALLGTAYPLLDPLPAPIFFAIGAALVALGASSLFIRARLRGRQARKERGAVILVCLAIALAIVGLASSASRRQSYAVIWADSISSVPSDSSAFSVAVIRGSTARIRGAARPGGAARLEGEAGSYAGVALADGVEGWAPLGSLYFY